LIFYYIELSGEREMSEILVDEASAVNAFEITFKMFSCQVTRQLTDDLSQELDTILLQYV
jgi:hypothetical protein